MIHPHKKCFLALTLSPLLFSTAPVSNAAPAYSPVGTVVLVDFGTDLSYRGLSASSPDANGSYWNSFMPGAYLALVDRTNRASGINLGLSTPAATDSYNGPAGNTTSGTTTNLVITSYTNAVLDAASLGYFAEKKAAFDYICSPTDANGVASPFVLALDGLDPARTYTLAIFGSQKYAADTSTVYTVYDAQPVDPNFPPTTLGTSTLVVGNGGNHNSNNVAVINNLHPTTLGFLYLQVRGSTNGIGYINSLMIDDNVPVTPAPTNSVLQTILVDFGSSAQYRSASVVGADSNGNLWNSVDELKYWQDLVNTGGTATTVDFGFLLGTTFGVDSYNGPAGAVTNIPVTATDIANATVVSSALGALGGSKAAVMDYIRGTNVRMEIAGLNPTHKFTLKFFGSHKFDNSTNSTYQIYSDSGFTTLLGSANLAHRDPTSAWLHNTNKVATITNISPNTNGAIYLRLTGSGTDGGFLNAMSIEEIGSASGSDTTPPVITLNPGASSVEWGQVYTDPGASASDNVGVTSLTTNPVSVNTAILGNQTITYTAQDAAGNRTIDNRVVAVILPANAGAPDADGVSPLMRYALGGVSPSSAVTPPQVSSSATDLVLSAVVRTNPAPMIIAETAPSVTGPWTPVAGNGSPSASQAGATAGVSQRRDFTVPRSGDRLFLRLKATAP